MTEWLSLTLTHSLTHLLSQFWSWCLKDGQNEARDVGEGLQSQGINYNHLTRTRGFPGGSDDRESACNLGDTGSISGLERFPREGNGNPCQYSCLENPHGQRSLVGYSPWGHKESDMTEWLNNNSEEQVKIYNQVCVFLSPRTQTVSK